MWTNVPYGGNVVDQVPPRPGRPWGEILFGAPRGDMETTEPRSVAALVERLVECAAPVAQIADHMACTAESEEDLVAVVRTVIALLGDVLTPLATQHPPGDLEAAEAILASASAILRREVLLVPHVDEPVLH